MTSSLDYSRSDRVVNFRDVGEFTNLLLGKNRIQKGVIYRGGTIRYAEDASAFGSPSRILNLQKGPDPEHDGVENLHFPIENDIEKYRTETREVRRWLRRILEAIANAEKFPIYIHCHSGKDRTGVVVAALLLSLGIPRETIIEEYLLSDGETKREWIEWTLDGIGDPRDYFGESIIRSLRHHFLS